MLDTPEIAHTTAQQAAVIHLTIPRSEIQQAMGPAFGELMATLGAQGIKQAGPFFSHHFRMDPATFDFEVGVPVASPVQPAGRVKAGALPAAQVVRTNYRGPYEGLGAAWGEFCAWIKTHGHTPRADLWEVYVKGPDVSPNPADWCTELNMPLVE